MRPLRFLVLILLAGLIGAGTSLAVVGSGRANTFSVQAALLRQTWQQDLAVGVPASTLAPLEAQLSTGGPRGGWWSPLWWTRDGQPLVDRLRQETAAAYAGAVANQREAAELVLYGWRLEVDANTTYLVSSDPLAVQNASTELSDATTPDQISTLAAGWQQQLTTMRAQIGAAQQAATLAAEVAAAGGPTGLLSQAASVAAQASGAQLNPGNVPVLAAELQSALSTGTDVAQASDQLYDAIQDLNQAIVMNTQLNASLRTVYLTVLQAAAEGAPDAAGLMAQDQAVDQGLAAATTYEQLDLVNRQMTALQAGVASDLSADQCGHQPSSGKLITISLTYQEMVMYDNGCEVNATPVTTGRPSAPTNVGDFEVFQKLSPCLMHSPWAAGTALWYPDTVVQWAMQFQDGGYFIHDAYWEALSSYGPGSEFETWNDTASRGCVQTPTAIMGWLYDWTPLGTPVIITD